MSVLRVAARRLPRASKLVASVESPLQRRFAATSAAQAKVGAIAVIDR
jgi:acetylornithine aminotransferase